MSAFGYSLSRAFSHVWDTSPTRAHTYMDTYILSRSLLFYLFLFSSPSFSPLLLFSFPPLSLSLSLYLSLSLSISFSLPFLSPLLLLFSFPRSFSISPLSPSLLKVCGANVGVMTRCAELLRSIDVDFVDINVRERERERERE